MTMIDSHNHVGVELLNYFTGRFPYCQHLLNLVEEGRVLGVGRWIVMPCASHLGLDLHALQNGQIADSETESVPYSFENRRLLREIRELSPDAGKDAIPFVMFDPGRNVAGQIKALRALREEYSFSGLYAYTSVIQSPITHLKDEARPFLELAAEWDIPIFLHSSVLDSDRWAKTSDVVDIAEANPQIRFGITHSLCFDRRQLDRVADLPNAWFTCSALRIYCQLAVYNNPAVAMPELRFKSDYTRPSRVLRDLAETYPGKMLWGSGSPFYSLVALNNGAMMRLVSTYAHELAALRALPGPLQQQIAQANTLQFLQMKAE